MAVPDWVIDIGKDVIDRVIPSGNNPTPGLAPNASGDCPGAWSVKVGGRCVNLGDLGPGGPPATTPLQSTPGGLHAGDHLPTVVASARRQCQKGSVLGTDGFCHRKRDIRNSDRAYPKPRRPLGTSGDLNAVTKASRFGRRLKANEKRLKKLGRDLETRGRR